MSETEELKEEIKKRGETWIELDWGKKYRQLMQENMIYTAHIKFDQYITEQENELNKTWLNRKKEG